ncbi:MAG TPA: DUF6328 family protein [Jatrophihabitans sp.]|jgi:hypothetical protein|nr:DUF6328 family protein [Jatrophihabitans sp.]
MADDDYSRDESEAERLDRNYGELLQELRVAQTGVQILFAFLLGIAFQQRFTTLHNYQRILYMVTLISASCSAILLIAPAAMHRVLFRRHMKDQVVEFTARFATAGLAFLAVAVLSAVLFTLDVVSGLPLAVSAAGGLGLIVLTTWLLLPLYSRHRHRHEEPDL